MDYDVENWMERTVIFIMEFGRRHDLNMKQVVSVVLSSDTCNSGDGRTGKAVLSESRICVFFS